jgi:hypothetical protein
MDELGCKMLDNFAQPKALNAACCCWAFGYEYLPLVR